MVSAKGFSYKQEMDLLCMQDTRNNFISKLVATRQNNTLVLFQFVEKHGKPLERKLRFYCEGKQIHLVYGGTEAEQRERVRQICETHNNVVILASYGVYQQGINIKNLHNIVFASPTKSKIRVLQSIGRGLRTHESKEACNLYDIGDDLRGNRKKPNITLNHLLERAKMYQQEGFNVEFITKEV
jgi:superfamily II DNA or RNA helicase